MDNFVNGARAHTPLTPSAKAPTLEVREDAKKKTPHRQVDVAQFHNLPLAGTPTVSAAEDATLVNLDPVNKLLSKLETKGKALATGVKGYRYGTEVVGPAAWGLSAFLTIKLLRKTLKDPTIGAGSKVALTVATVANSAGAVLAVASSRFVGPLLHLGTAGRIVMNKCAGMVGGIGGTIFNVINLIETLRNKDAKPAERFFAKLGFVLGMAGFVFGSLAMMASMPWMAGVATKLPWLLPVATKIGNTVGIVGMFAWLGQLFMGKNPWLNTHLKGTVLG